MTISIVLGPLVSFSPSLASALSANWSLEQPSKSVRPPSSVSGHRSFLLAMPSESSSASGSMVSLSLGSVVSIFDAKSHPNLSVSLIPSPSASSMFNAS